MVIINIKDRSNDSFFLNNPKRF